jgi:hypothetical protein
MDIETISEFLGWCTVVNFGILIISTIKILTLRDWASKIHAKMFRIDEESVRKIYLHFLVLYKVAFLALNLVPYLALQLMENI